MCLSLGFVLDFALRIFGAVKRNAKNIRYTHTFFNYAFCGFGAFMQDFALDLCRVRCAKIAQKQQKEFI